MTSNTQSFIVSGTIMSFECDIDLTAPSANERIDELAGDLRTGAPAAFSAVPLPSRHT